MGHEVQNDIRPSARGLLLGAPLAAGLASSAVTLALVLRGSGTLVERWGRGGLALLVLALALSGLLCGGLLVSLARGRRRPAGLAPLRMAFVCVVLGWGVYVLWLQPYWALTVAVTMSLALGGFALLWLLAPLVSGHLPRGLTRALDFGLFQLCLIVVLAELALGLYGRYSDSRLFDLGREDAAGALARWRLEPGGVHMRSPVNSRGDADAEPSEPPRDHPFVVCIGDSFSAGVVPGPAHFTSVAERRAPGLEVYKPGLEVYNMGAPSVGPREYLHLLVTEALPLEPDLVVVDLFVGNDIEDELVLTRSDNLVRRWFVGRDLALAQLARRLPRLRAERARRGGDSVGGAQGTGSGVALPPEQLPRAMPWLADPSLERPSNSVEAFEDMERHRALVACGAGTDTAPFFRRMEELRAAAGGVPLAVMLIPDEFQVEDALWERVRVLNGDVELERDRPQRLITAWCAERGVPVLDLLPLMRAAEPLHDGRRHLYHLRDTHWNARGNRVAGEALAAFVDELLGGR